MQKLSLLLFFALAVAPAMSVTENSYAYSYVVSSYGFSSLLTDEITFLTAELSMPSVVEALDSYYDEQGIADVDDSTHIQYIEYLEAKYPQLAKAIRAIVAAERYYPSIAEYESQLIEAAMVDPDILAQFEVFTAHQSQLARAIRDHRP